MTPEHRDCCNLWVMTIYYNLEILLLSGNGQSRTVNPICGVRIVFFPRYIILHVLTRDLICLYITQSLSLRNSSGVFQSALILTTNGLVLSGKLPPHSSSVFLKHLYWAELVSDPNGTPVQRPVYFFPLFVMFLSRKHLMKPFLLRIQQICFLKTTKFSIVYIFKCQWFSSWTLSEACFCFSAMISHVSFPISPLLLALLLDT